MKYLNVLYDANCAFCCRCRQWLQRQPAFVELRFIQLQSPNLESWFPGIGQFRPDQDLIVIDDCGGSIAAQAHGSCASMP